MKSLNARRETLLPRKAEQCKHLKVVFWGVTEQGCERVWLTPYTQLQRLFLHDAHGRCRPV